MVNLNSGFLSKKIISVYSLDVNSITLRDKDKILFLCKQFLEKKDSILNQLGKELSTYANSYSKFSKAKPLYSKKSEYLNVINDFLDFLEGNFSSEDIYKVLNRQGVKSKKTVMHYLLDNTLDRLTPERTKRISLLIDGGYELSEEIVSNINDFQQDVDWYYNLLTLLKRLSELGAVMLKDANGITVKDLVGANVLLSDFATSANLCDIVNCPDKNITYDFRYPHLIKSLLDKVTMVGGNPITNIPIKDIWILGAGSEYGRSPQVEEVIAACPNSEKGLVIDENDDVIRAVKEMQEINPARFECYETKRHLFFLDIQDYQALLEGVKKFNSTQKPSVTTMQSKMKWSPDYFKVLKNMATVSPDIIIMTKVVSYLIESSSTVKDFDYNIRVLSSIIDCLKPGGRIVLDLTAIRFILNQADKFFMKLDGLRKVLAALDNVSHVSPIINFLIGKDGIIQDSMELKVLENGEEKGITSSPLVIFYKAFE